MSIRMIAKMVNMHKETVGQILHDQLNTRKVCAKKVPKDLNQEQMTTGKTFALTSWNDRRTVECA
jgi:hypothetical protein